MIVIASLTERCNLTCDYCYGSLKTVADMSAENADRVVDFAVSKTPMKIRWSLVSSAANRSCGLT